MVSLHSTKVLARISSQRGKDKTTLKWGENQPRREQRVRNMKGSLWGLKGTLVYNLVKGGSHRPLEECHLPSQGT